MEQLPGLKHGTYVYRFNGYLYAYSNKKGNTTYYRCIVRKCSGSAISDGIEARCQGRHSIKHEPDESHVEFRLFRQELRSSAANSNKNLRQLYDELANRYPLGSLQYAFPAALQMMRRARATSSAQTSCMIDDIKVQVMLAPEDWYLDDNNTLLTPGTPDVESDPESMNESPDSTGSVDVPSDPEPTEDSPDSMRAAALSNTPQTFSNGRFEDSALSGEQASPRSFCQSVYGEQTSPRSSCQFVKREQTSPRSSCQYVRGEQASLRPSCQSVRREQTTSQPSCQSVRGKQTRPRSSCQSVHGEQTTPRSSCQSVHEEQTTPRSSCQSVHGEQTTPRSSCQSARPVVTSSLRTTEKKARTYESTPCLSIDKPGSFRMAIVLENFPENKLSDDDVDRIGVHLTSSVRALDDGLGPQMKNWRSEAGALELTCMNVSTKAWLEDCVRTLGELDGLKLVIGEACSILNTYKVITRFPYHTKDMEMKAILEMLELQNPGVKASDWRVINTKVQNKGTTAVFHVVKEDVAMLKQNGFRLFCGIEQIPFKLLGAPRV